MTATDIRIIHTESCSRLSGQNLTLGYEGHQVCQNLDIDIPDGQFTVIVGSNGCGKSTLLKSLCRLLKPEAGHIYLDGKDIHELSTREVARVLGLLPQSANVPEGIKVADLVSRGRYPHQNLFRQWSEADEQAVLQAMEVTGVMPLAHQLVDQLSGGQRQRVWIAMVLAQQTPVILLDEPTTYLDIAHQIELLDLFRKLNRESGHTVIAVLHDLNHACRYADHLVAVKSGKIVAQGAPSALVTENLIRQVFGLESLVIDDPVSGTPMVIPR